MKFNKIAWCLGLLFAASTCFAQSNPRPSVDQPLVPTAVAPGGPGFTLTVSGTGFVPTSVVNWNGIGLTTTFVGPGRVTADVPEANVADFGTAMVTVKNPPPGGGTSNAVAFAVTYPTTSLTFASSGYTIPGAGIVADFNNDGKADIALFYSVGPDPYLHEGSASILLGNGDGTFTLRSTFGIPLPTDPFSCPGCFVGQGVAGDFNGDGTLDLAVPVNILGLWSIAYYTGNGDGTFTPAAQPGEYDTLDSLTVGADFKGDGHLDVVAVVSRPPQLFGADFDAYAFGYVTGPIVVGDFNNDGIPDLIAFTESFLPQPNGNVMTVGLGKGDGTFSYPPAPPPSLVSLASTDTADFNGDGILDLVAADSASSLKILLGNGDGTFTEKDGGPILNGGPAKIADFNGDGKLDLVAGDTVYLGNGDGTFQSGLKVTGSVLGFADFNGDGRMDLVAGNPDGTVSILLQVVDTTPPAITVSASPTTLWPPNGKMVPVTVTGKIIDTDSGVNANTTAYSVIDEYGQVQPSGRIVLGPGGTYSFTIFLQASRAGTDKDGRQYTVTVSAKDNAGNVGSASTGVTVPHDQGH